MAATKDDLIKSLDSLVREGGYVFGTHERINVEPYKSAFATLEAAGWSDEHTGKEPAPADPAALQADGSLADFEAIKDGPLETPKAVD